MSYYWGNRRGEMVNTAKLDAELVREIRQLAKEGKTGRELAPLYGVHQTTIARVVRKETWRHIK